MSEFVFPVGIIDIGSNSVRLMFTDGNFIKKNLIITRLGGGFDGQGNLSFESMLTTAKAISALKEEALTNGAKSIYAFATAAVRKAKNKAEFLSLVKDVSGVFVDVISGDTEAELAVLGALGKESGAVIDVGGASSEIAFSDNGKIVYKFSHNIGAVTLFSDFNRDENAITKKLDELIIDKPFYGVKTVKAIGGTATSLAVLDLRLKKYDSKIIDGHYISFERLIELKDYAYLKSPTYLSKNYAIEPKRAEVIAGGASIIIKILKSYGLDGISVSESDNLEGYLKYVKKYYGKKKT